MMATIIPVAGGLSPRGRGKQQPRHITPPSKRSIPAWAGETKVMLDNWRAATVYPRVGGGNASIDEAHVFLGGLSPRGRGKLFGLKPVPAGQGSIPAWAGETRHLWRYRNQPGVYPRVGGGNTGLGRNGGDADGLSPRGRGKRGGGHRGDMPGRSIPAWAGETSPCSRSSRGVPVYPRVGGGNLRLTSNSRRFAGLSPRGRGKPRANPGRRIDGGSIPAWAGETGRRRRY